MLNFSELIDLDVAHVNKNSPGPIFVTFSAWSPSGEENYFGMSFFQKNKIEGFLVRHKNKSLWWHTDEIFLLADLIRKYAHAVERKIILYGSSMGGYAAVHLRDTFCSDLAISISPQIILNKSVAGFEKRWPSDIEYIQSRFVFDEVICGKNSSPLYIFWDPLHLLDNTHVDFFRRYCSGLQSKFFEVPYSNHDTARLLYSSRQLEVLVRIAYSGLPAKEDFINECSLAYRSDAKSFCNYFRKLNKSEIEEPDVDIFYAHSSTFADLDFEGLYMAAECYFLLGSLDLAREYINSSISKYIKVFSKPAPDYLYLKKKAIFRC